MTPCAPTSALRQAIHTPLVDHSTDQDVTPLELLEMAFQAEVGVADTEHLGVDAAMRAMAGGAAFAQRLVFEHERAPHSRMAFQTVLLARQQEGTASYVGDTLVGRVALDAGHSAFGHGVMIGKVKLAAHLRMAFVTEGLLGPRRQEGQSRPRTVRLWTPGGEAVGRFYLATGVGMQVAGPVT